MKPEELIKNNALTDISVSNGQKVVPLEIALTAINMTRMETPKMAQKVIEERKRQIEVEKFSLEKDAEYYKNGELAQAAAAYAVPFMLRKILLFHAGGVLQMVSSLWPYTWDWKMWKPAKTNSVKERIRELEKAGALILAEMERLQGMSDKYIDIDREKKK
ncbi:MAG: hypothetical protein LKI39_02610 [Bacteroides sp.]|jgi:hypothetical protein|nr:hypothetical protein [Bacteroides sp.]